MNIADSYTQKMEESLYNFPSRIYFTNFDFIWDTSELHAHTHIYLFI
jgi:hypothetical protein